VVADGGVSCLTDRRKMRAPASVKEYVRFFKWKRYGYDVASEQLAPLIASLVYWLLPPEKICEGRPIVHELNGPIASFGGWLWILSVLCCG